MIPRCAEELAAAFEEHRPYLRRVAYGTLGSVADADDVVQEAWLRLERSDVSEIRDLRAWLTTVVGRLALDALGTARRRRERYVGPWLPEPLVGDVATVPTASAGRPRGDGLGAAGVARSGQDLAHEEHEEHGAAHEGRDALQDGRDGLAPRARPAIVAGGSRPEVDGDPADRVALHERVTTALLVVLERLSPAERTAFVLHDVFGLPFGEVAEVVGRSPAAVRQLAARARRHVAEGTPRFPATPEQHAQLVAAFGAAWQAGDVDGLLSLLDPDVTCRADGGGIVTTARRPLLGAARVARALVALAGATAARGIRTDAGIADVNGLPGLVIRGDVLSVVSFTIDAGRIVAIDIVRNPDKLRHVPAPPPASGPPPGPGA